MPVPGGMPPAPPWFFLGTSATIASVVIRRAATEAAFWSATRTTLVGSMISASGGAKPALPSYGGDHETRFAMTSKSWISRLGAPLIAFVLTVAPSVSQVHAVDDARKVSVVSFGLFGDQGVFRSEATGAAQVVAGRFGSGPINVQYNSKKGGGATIEGLAMYLQAAAKGMDVENDILFLILTSHGSRAGLAEKAGRLTQTLTPSNLAEMLARTGMRYRVVVISACYSRIFIPPLPNPHTR